MPENVDTKGRGSESDEKHQAPVRGKKEAKVETKGHFKKGIQKWIQKGAVGNVTKSTPNHPDMICWSSSALRCDRIAGQRHARYDKTAPCARRSMCPHALQETGR